MDNELTLRVEARDRAADGVVTLVLGDPAGRPLPSWTPGAHIDLVLGAGDDHPPVRQYSLCGDPADPCRWRLGVLREAEGGGTSRFVHDVLTAGDSVRVRGPRNHFELEPAPRYLFVAGGIGVTPILPMVAAADSAGAEWRLVYGGRMRSSMAFLDELEAYGERVTVCPQDETGLLDLQAVLAQPEEGTLVYCCGPEPLLAAMEEHCASWPVDMLRVERFAARPLDEPHQERSFEVELSQSGVTLVVPADRSVLEVVEGEGIDVLTSCEEGTCGTCETAVLEGLPDHRDSVLTAKERAANDCMLICVSRSLSDRLVLDL